ncbi:hypothetical protein D3C80_728430 [compost metagenome]
MVQRTIDMALEGDALLVELAQAGQGHDLEAAAIRQDRTIPADQLVQATEARDAFSTGTQHQVIGIAEDDIGAGVLDLVEIHRLDRANGADRHEGGSTDRAARHGDFAKARAGVGLLQGELEILGAHLVFPK